MNYMNHFLKALVIWGVLLIASGLALGYRAFAGDGGGQFAQELFNYRWWILGHAVCGVLLLVTTYVLRARYKQKQVSH